MSNAMDVWLMMMMMMSVLRLLRDCLKTKCVKRLCLVGLKAQPRLFHGHTDLTWRRVCIFSLRDAQFF
jgi:hypothetical protein